MTAKERRKEADKILKRLGLTWDDWIILRIVELDFDFSLGDMHIASESKVEPKVEPEVESDVDLEVRITNRIRKMGCPSHIKGYFYIRTAIELLYKDPMMGNVITKLLYPTIAKTHCTTPSRVERAIRHAIEVVWNRGNIELLQELFGYTVAPEKGKPTNSEFLTLIADQLRMEDRRRKE